MKKFGKIVSVILLRIVLILCALIVGVNLYLANAASVGRDQLPTPFGYGAAVVLSGSMEPVLSVNDLIIVKETDDYAVGDIIVFQDQSALTVHSVIALDETTVQTQGKANNTPDAPIDRALVKGKVIFTIPGIGVAFDIIKSPAGTILLSGLAIFLLWRSYRNEKEEDQKKLEAIKAEIRRLKESDAPAPETLPESEVDADARE